jgi:hypothetical protein
MNAQQKICSFLLHLTSNTTSMILNIYPSSKPIYMSFLTRSLSSKHL